ncbi:hypothetical protein CK203_009013 [Vitis vinifera]|uniref:Reverse transcriptase zinc-binding domain-containing protein n=1 Tax=Vitis vinifera TaxID=29760 RepID=A0A438K301_VITVI|nr:hypothetical protein CK203_009013 [Vitis vinifera]
MDLEGAGCLISGRFLWLGVRVGGAFFEEIWRVKACSNVKFFRDAKWEEIPTKDPWMKHGWSILGSPLFSIKDLTLGWHDGFLDERCREVWKMTPFCLYWLIWKKRNRRTLRE